ncbi:MAG TPA: AMP-binding protein [Terriglobales bacterium]|nr:AMP-binding protein [Terriglobales bacterium]
MSGSRLDNWIMETEGLPALDRAALEELQLGRLNALLKRERVRSGFYKDLPEALRSLDDLSGLPFTTEADLAQNAAGMLLLSQREVERVITDRTSGTAAPPKRVFYTEGDMAATVGFFAAGLGELVYPGDAVLIAMPFSAGGGLGELIAKAIHRLGARPVRAGIGKSYGELAALIEKERPTAYVGMPVPLLSLLRFCGPISLKRALVSADTLPQSVMADAGRILGERLFPHYGSREIGLGGAVTCPAHEGMHIRENHIIAEIVDGEGSPVPDGERGLLAVTTIGLEAIPLIRYLTGDAARILPGACRCGGVTKRLADVRRIAAGHDIAELDNALFFDPNLVDCAAALSAGKLEIDALTLDGTAGRLLELAMAALPELRISVRARTAHMEDTPCYVAKRKFLTT